MNGKEQVFIRRGGVRAAPYCSCAPESAFLCVGGHPSISAFCSLRELVSGFISKWKQSALDFSSLHIIHLFIYLFAYLSAKLTSGLALKTLLQNQDSERETVGTFIAGSISSAHVFVSPKKEKKTVAGCEWIQIIFLPVFKIHTRATCIFLSA